MRRGRFDRSSPDDRRRDRPRDYHGPSGRDRSSPDDRRRDFHGSAGPDRRYSRGGNTREPYQTYNARHDPYTPPHERPAARSGYRNRNNSRNDSRDRRPEGEPMVGRLIRLEYDRGFGFVRPKKSKVDVFVHFSEFKNIHPDDANIGDVMEFHMKSGGAKKDKAVYAMRTKAFVPVEQQIEAAAPERGIVVAARASSGTISRLEEARDLRFEYDDMQVRRSRPRTGDSVEFKVVELPDGKTIGVDVRILPRGTVSLEEELAPRRQATITAIQLQQQPQQKRFGGARAGRGGRRMPEDTQYKGKLTVQEETSAAKEDASKSASGATKESKNTKTSTHPFVSSEVIGGLVLGVGDVVSVSLMQHKRTKKIRVSKVVLEQLGGARETGVIHTSKEVFGFIECCERDTQIFFHFSEMLPEMSSLREDSPTTRRRMVPRNGQEVSFEILEAGENSASKNNIKAVRVLPLPPGSVSFETLVQADCVGVVAHVPRHKPDYAYSRESKSKKDSNNGGSVTLLAAEAIQALGDDSLQSHASLESMIADNTNFPFSSREVSSLELRHAQRRSLVPRDVVCFDLFLQKRTKKHKAANVRLVRMAPEFESLEGVWSGVVSLECREDNATRAPARREWNNKSARGEVSLDKMQVGLELADADIKSILSVQKIFFSSDVPVVKDTGAASASPSEHANADTSADPEPVAEPPPPPGTETARDVTPDTSTFLRYNSAVRVSLKRRIVDKSLWVDRVIGYTQASRVEGVVVQVRESYGFIKCKQKKHNVYFSYSELLPSTPTDGKTSPDPKTTDQLRNGDKVTFFLHAGGEGGRKREASPRRLRPGRGEEDVCAVEVMRVPEKLRPRLNVKLMRASCGNRQRTAKGPPSDGSIGFKLVRTNTETDTEAVASSTTDTAATSTAIDEA